MCVCVSTCQLSHNYVFVFVYNMHVHGPHICVLNNTREENPDEKSGNEYKEIIAIHCNYILHHADILLKRLDNL